MAPRVSRLDDLQRRRPWIAFPLGVVYKFLDDQGNYLAAIVTYYAFIAVFPLLLIASSVLGFVLQGDATLRDEVLTSALAQFPIVGTQLGRPEGLQGSASAVVIGGLAALYGVLGLGQAAQNAVNVVWAIPRNSRLNPVVSRLRSFLLLLLAGLTVLLVAVLSSIGSHLDIVGSDFNQGLRLGVGGSAVVLNAFVLALMMRFATTERRGLLETLPGAMTVAVLWQGLQLLGGAYVGHVVARANSLNGTFALVLGLIALIYIASVMAVFGLEINVVLAKRLYPRALLTPFTDSVELTDADRRVYTENAQAQRLKGFERVHVFFDGDPSDRAE
jgi:membrane protein